MVGEERGERDRTFSFVLSHVISGQNTLPNTEHYYDAKNLEGEFVATLRSLFTRCGKMYLSLWKLPQIFLMCSDFSLE